MLGNCEKMVLISSSSNQWPQNHPSNLDHEMGSNLMGSSSSCGGGGLIIMEKTSSSSSELEHKAEEQQNEVQLDPTIIISGLRCPRCDSSNTKFCYYNNYSLSQPRHFCKACKRYWTRGGTLRTVPVGGACRKNKRLKIRPTSSAATTAPLSSNQLHNHDLNMFYGGGGSDLNRSFSGYDHRHLNFVGLGFDRTDFNFNGFDSSSLLSGYSSLFPNNPSSTSVAFKSDVHHQNLDSPPFDHRRVMGSDGGDQVVDHGIIKRLDWNNNNNNNQQNQTDEIVSQSNYNDPNLVYANWSSQTWHDPTNLASSITSSLI